MIQIAPQKISREQREKTITMKAAVIHKFGDTNEFKYEDVKKPSPKPGNILIKILAAGVNRFDHYIREGSVVQDISFPHILGSDASGEVAELGEDVTNFKIGERVIPMPGYPEKETDYNYLPLAAAPSFTVSGMRSWGTYAQYIEMPARWVLKDNSGLQPEEVAALPMAMFTGVRAVKIVGEVKGKDKVLIHAGASGTGSMMIQIAKALGADVATTVLDEISGEFTTELGADFIVNVRKDDFVDKIMEWTDGNGADVVMDNLGGHILSRSIDAAKTLGTIVAMGFISGTEVTFDIRDFFFEQKQLRGSMFGDIEDYNWGIKQIRKGKIKPVIDRVLPLSEAAEAHRLMDTNQVRGKIILLPWAD